MDSAVSTDCTPSMPPYLLGRSANGDTILVKAGQDIKIAIVIINAVP